MNGIPCLLLLAMLTTVARAGSLVIDNVNVIDTRSGDTLADRAVVIEDGRVAAIAAAGTQAGDRLIDAEGGWLIPGLAEMHAHVPAEDRGERYARDVLGLFLANGVTTVRGMLGQAWHLELRQLLASGSWEGPRLITSGPSFNGRTVTSPEQAAERVREQAKAGYDFVKIHPGLSRDEFLALASAARELGIPFAGHVSFETGLAAALEAGQDTIDHLDAYAEAMLPAASPMAGVAPRWFGLNLAVGMDASRAPALAEATAAAGVAVVPTQSLFETSVSEESIAALEARPGMQFLSPGLAARWRQSVGEIRAMAPPGERERFLAARRTLLLALQQAGGVILLGSDAPQIMNVPGFSVHQELAWLVEAGLTPLQALQTGTINVATFFGDRNHGEVAAGYVADFILLESNPLEDIGATTGIRGVMRNGTWYGRERLDGMLKGVRERGI